MSNAALRQVLAVLSVAAALVSGVAGCESEGPLSSGDLVQLNGRRQCTGAYTPHSTACWEDPGDGGEGEVSANTNISQELMDEVAGTDRCASIIGPPGTKGTMTVTFTTVTTNGLYAPRNCGAVWIEKAAPLLEYVRTLEIWAAERQMSIVQWNSRACHSDPTLLKPDVTTSATLPEPKTHTVTWNLEDFRGNVVPDGDYVLWMQVAENEIFPEGPFLNLPFTKDATPFTMTLPSADGFRDISITYTPAP